MSYRSQGYLTEDYIKFVWAYSDFVPESEINIFVILSSVHSLNI